MISIPVTLKGVDGAYAELTDFLRQRGLRLVAGTVNFSITPGSSEISASVELSVEPDETVATQPEVTPAVPEPAPDVPAEVAMDVPAEVVPAEVTAAPPSFSFSFEQAVIANLNTTHRIPVSYDPELESSVLRVPTVVTVEDQSQRITFAFATNLFSVPVFTGGEIVENAGEVAGSPTFLALVRLMPAEQPALHRIQLRVESGGEGTTEQLILGKDMSTLITEHEDPQDASVP